VFDRNDFYFDDFEDEFAEILAAIRACDGWTKSKYSLISDLEKLGEKKGYIYFRGHYQRYHVTRVGESAIVFVPPGRRGHLRKFAGDYVRIICVGSGRFDRGYIAGKVNSRKPENYLYPYREIAEFKYRICVDGSEFERESALYLSCYENDPLCNSNAVYSSDQKLEFYHDGYGFGEAQLDWVLCQPKFKRGSAQVRFIAFSPDRDHARIFFSAELKKPLTVSKGNIICLRRFTIRYFERVGEPGSGKKKYYKNKTFNW
jgi:hypothetical protein